MSTKAEALKVRQLIDGVQQDNPRLYQALIALSNDVSALYEELHPITAATSILTRSSTPPNVPLLISYTFGPFTVNFVWVGDETALFFELRYGGSDWDTATFVVKTPSNGASIDALLVGSHVFRLKSINLAGLYSVDDIEVTVVIPAIAAPSISAQVIDNNVLLYWTPPPSTFQIDHYNVYVDGVQFAAITSTFISRFEIISATYLYGVEAVDVAGNVSAMGNVSAVVNQPKDFEVIDNRAVVLANMTLVNALLEHNKIIACVDVTEQYQTHFTSKSWATPQEQVDDAYERFIQENLLTGSALDQFDYGTTLNNIIATVTFVKETFSGVNDVVVEGEMSVSPDGSSWSTPSAGLSQFFTSFRYLRTKLIFTAADADSMIALSNIRVILNVRRETDANSIQCNAADSGGTEVQVPGDFSAGHGSKAFKDIESITATPRSTTPLTCVIDFVDIPNPTHFFIYVFNSSGTRVDSVVDWIVKGIT